MKMTDGNYKGWHINRQISIGVLIQIVLLASLIVGSWVNLQQQLDLLQHDFEMLIQSNDKFQQKLESLFANSISYEYRLRAIEKIIADSDKQKKNY